MKNNKNMTESLIYDTYYPKCTVEYNKNFSDININFYYLSDSMCKILLDKVRDFFIGYPRTQYSIDQIQLFVERELKYMIDYNYIVFDYELKLWGRSMWEYITSEAVNE